MKTLQGARSLLWNIIEDWEEYFEKHKYDEDFDAENEKDDIETLHYILEVVVDCMSKEEEKKGDRLDKLLDSFEDDLRNLHGISCVCLSLNTMENELQLLGEWGAAGRCNEIQHKYLG